MKGAPIAISAQNRHPFALDTVKQQKTWKAVSYHVENSPENKGDGNQKGMIPRDLSQGELHVAGPDPYNLLIRTKIDPWSGIWVWGTFRKSATNNAKIIPFIEKETSNYF